MKNVVINTIKKYNMIEKGDKIIVGVSGGPDSMCLLHLLYSLREDLRIKEIFVAHINHCIRGKEADEDEKFVENFCLQNNIKFFSKRANINKLAKEKGVSSESIGREIRYSFFYELKEKLNAQKIALAHNCNDQAETVLMRIMRGTGLEGLGGIKAIREGIYIRPLISVLRKDIENYCDSNNLKPRIDRTNLETIYTRNKIRLQLIPFIKENFNEDIIGTLNKLSLSVSKDNEYLKEIANEKYKIYCDRKGKKVIISKEAFLQPEAILSRIIRKVFYNIKGNLYNFESKHISDIINIQKSETGKSIMLPDNIKAENVYKDIHIFINGKNKKEKELSFYNLKLGDNYLKKLDILVKLNLVNIFYKDNYKNKDNELVQYFDFDKVNTKDIILRNRKPGDKFTPLGMKGNKKLKDLFIDLKIPREERDKINIICFKDEIAWITGYRTSNKFKVDKDTKNILQIIIKGGI